MEATMNISGPGKVMHSSIIKPKYPTIEFEVVDVVINRSIISADKLNIGEQSSKQKSYETEIVYHFKPNQIKKDSGYSIRTNSKNENNNSVISELKTSYLKTYTNNTFENTEPSISLKA